jgi:RNA polymerase sigma-70 factor (ECF subfamily)
MPQLQKTAARLLRNAEDAEDALQDGLLSAFRHLDQFQGRARFTTWMHTIVANAAKSKLRRQRSGPFIFSLDEPGPEREEVRLADMLADPQTNLDDEFGRVEEFRILATILEELPSALRVVVLLCDIEGLKVREAAAQLGMTISAVKTRHFRANRLLLKMVKKACMHQRPGNDFENPFRRLRHPARRAVLGGARQEGSGARQARSTSRIP